MAHTLGAAHTAVGALGAVSYVAARASLWRRVTTPGVEVTYAWMLIMLAVLALLALVQSLALRAIFGSLRRWIPLTLGAGALAGVVIIPYIVWVSDAIRTLRRDIFVSMLISAIIAVAQWWELRRSTHQAIWWIVASVTGSIAFWLAFAALGGLGPVRAATDRWREVPGALGLAVQVSAGLLAYAAITALAVWVIARARVPATSLIRSKIGRVCGG